MVLLKGRRGDAASVVAASEGRERGGDESGVGIAASVNNGSHRALEQRNFTLGCAPMSASFSTCFVPQWLQAPA